MKATSHIIVPLSRLFCILKEPTGRLKVRVFFAESLGCHVTHPMLSPDSSLLGNLGVLWEVMVGCGWDLCSAPFSLFSVQLRQCLNTTQTPH